MLELSTLSSIFLLSLVLRQSIYNFVFCEILCRTFLVKLQLDDVLQVLLVIGLKLKKKYDDCLINGGDISFYALFRKKEEEIEL